MIEKQYKQKLHLWHLYYLLRNSIDFPLRNFFHWTRPIRDKKIPDASLLLSHFEKQNQTLVRSLWQTYHLNEIELPFSYEQMQVNMYYLALFIRSFSALDMEWADQIRVADVGPSDWFYLPALVNFLRYDHSPAGRTVSLEGYEVDPLRVYADYHTRQDHALQRCAAFNGVHFVPHAFTNQPEQFDILVQCFPFLFLKDHLKWGLPVSLFDPQGLFQKLESSLKPGGLLLIVNQGSEEKALQKKILATGKLTLVAEFLFQSTVKTYSNEHLVMVLKK
jgi:hypothetical protein